MFGLILISLGTFFEEIAGSIGKKKVREKKETIYAMAFLFLFWGTLWFLGVILYKQRFDFSLGSLPTFSVRLVLEVIQVYVSMKAIVLAERSTYGFIRTGTLPLLLIVDLALGYTIFPMQIVGISFIVLSLLVLSLNHGIQREGLGLVLYSTVGAVATISLFKYNIANFNSVEAEQFLMHLFLLIFFYFSAIRKHEQNPIKLLKERIFFGQSFAEGAGSVLVSFAYLFAPASIITSAKRSTSVFWAILFGNAYFHEKHIVVKIISFLFLVVGVILLVV
ncbi:MAG: hypothetical protein HYT61_00990 [Candidatus Yanofskybacteria bacterium]|nr:hypothetical protein [Candidatus Yanofskybacteria bacterium]